MPIKIFTSALRLDFADAEGLREQLRGGSPLGVIGYGAERPDFLPASCPFLAGPLKPAGPDPVFELWSADTPARPFALGPVNGSVGEDFAFGGLVLDERRGLEASVEAAYLGIFDFLEASGLPAPIRFWNYLTGITEAEDGLERYRRFNIGRHRAFASRLRQPVPPAASGVGGHAGSSIIYFLAARNAARTLENPRQVSAFHYPPVYGPASPSFSRAAIHSLHDHERFFISGTASITGHQSRHPGDLAAQIDETLENLRALIGQASVRTDNWALKIYLRQPQDRLLAEPAIRTMFGENARLLYLLGEICRKDLLIEIEALRA